MLGTDHGRATTSDWRMVMKIDSWLLDVLACPKCHAPLRADDAASELICTGADCGLAYPVRDDIPVLLIDEARDPAAGDVRE
jgi:uncharacterized protein YbaR (Trm112 family)